MYKLLQAQSIRKVLKIDFGQYFFVRNTFLNKQIAHELGVSETTVKAHVSEILRKLNVVSRTQAVIQTARLDFEALIGDGAAASSS